MMLSLVDESPVYVKFANGRQVVWNASSLKAFRKCPRYYQHNILQGLSQKPGLSSERGTISPRLWGTLFHLGMQCYEENIHASDDQEKALFSVLRLLSRTWAVNNLEPTANRSLDTLLRAIVWHQTHYKNDGYQTLILKDGKLGVEQIFEREIPGTRCSLAGRVDRLVEDRAGGGVYLLDYKTTTQTLNKEYFLSFHPNIQFPAYLWMLQPCFGSRLRGFIVDGVQTAVNFTRLEREIVQYTQSQLDEFEDCLRESVLQASQFVDRDYFPMNEQSCNFREDSTFMGCEYRKICSEAPEFREQVIMDHYLKRQA